MSQGADDPIRGAQICLLNEHLPYELDMLLATYRELSKQIDDITRNALIESFWLHARNLREFYDGSATLDPKGSAAASHFTGRRFRPNFRGGIDAIINQQITHLQYGRPSGTGKLTSNDMKYVLEAILSVTRRFQAELRPEWARHFCLFRRAADGLSAAGQRDQLHIHANKRFVCDYLICPWPRKFFQLSFRMKICRTSLPSKFR